MQQATGHFFRKNVPFLGSTPLSYAACFGFRKVLPRPALTSPYLALPRLTAPYLALPRLLSPYLTCSRLLSPSLAFSRILSRSLAFSRLLSPSHAFSRLLRSSTPCSSFSKITRALIRSAPTWTWSRTCASTTTSKVCCSRSSVHS